jgi:hypothetical protein
MTHLSKLLLGSALFVIFLAVVDPPVTSRLWAVELLFMILISSFVAVKDK